MPSHAQHELQDKDILCTQDKSLGNHKGNCFFRNFVDQMLPAYKATKNKREKMNITKNMVDALQDTHGYRFVRFDEDIASWVEASAMVAREKVGHALRNAIRKERKKALKKIKPTPHLAAPPRPPYVTAQTHEIDDAHLPPVSAEPLSAAMGEVSNEPLRQERKSCFLGLSRCLSQGMLDLIDYDTTERVENDALFFSAAETSALEKSSSSGMFCSTNHTPEKSQTQVETQGDHPGVADMFRSFSGGFLAAPEMTTERQTIEDDLEPTRADCSISCGMAGELLNCASTSDPDDTGPPLLSMLELTRSDSSISVWGQACEADFCALDPIETELFVCSWLEGATK